MRRTRIIVPAVVAALVALGALAGTAAAARPRHEADHTKNHGHKKAKAMAGMTAAEMAAMTASETVDDRGFAKLANGEQHTHGFTQAVSKADRVLLAHQMELARETALQYPTVADAEAAGLHRAGPFSPGLGAHYVD